MSDNWTVEQQHALDEALAKYPSSMERKERWKYDFPYLYNTMNVDAFHLKFLVKQ